MIILATYKRPDNLKRFIEAYHATEGSEPVLLLIDENDNSYDSMRFPPGFSVLRIPHGCCASRRANIPFERFPNEPYYAIMGDDVIPLTPKWDVIMKERAGDWKIAYCADGVQNRNLATMPFIGGELVRAQGFVEEPFMLDWFADTCRTIVGREMGLLDYVEEVQFDHRHYLVGKSEFDETYAKQGDHARDQARFYLWLNGGGGLWTVGRIKMIMDEKAKKAAAV